MLPMLPREYVQLKYTAYNKLIIIIIIYIKQKSNEKYSYKNKFDILGHTIYYILNYVKIRQCQIRG